MSLENQEDHIHSSNFIYPFSEQKNSEYGFLDNLYCRSSLYLQSCLCVFFLDESSLKEKISEIKEDRILLIQNPTIPGEKYDHYIGKDNEIMIIDEFIKTLERRISLMNKIHMFLNL